MEIINFVDEIKPNILPLKAKVKWISRIDGRILSDLMKSFKKFEITMLKDQLEYELPQGVKGYDIIKGYVNNIEVLKTTPLERSGFYIAENSSGIECINLNAEPIPDQVLTIEYQYRIPSYDIDIDVELMAPEPYDTIYEYYLKAMIDKENEDFEGYQNNMQFFNSEFKDFARWHKQREPVRSSKIKNVW